MPLLILTALISNESLAIIGAIATIGAGVGISFLTSRAKSVDVWRDVAMGRQEQVEDREETIKEMDRQNVLLAAKVETLEADVRSLKQRDQAAVLEALSQHYSILQRIATAVEGGRAA